MSSRTARKPIAPQMLVHAVLAQVLAQLEDAQVEDGEHSLESYLYLDLPERGLSLDLSIGPDGQVQIRTTAGLPTLALIEA